MLDLVVCFAYSYAYKESGCLIYKDEIFFKIIYNNTHIYNFYIFTYKYIIYLYYIYL